MSGLSMRGCVYFKTKGSPCWKDLGNATKVEIVENVTESTRTSKRCDSFGQALDTISTKEPATFTMDFDELDTENLALAMLGDDITATQTAAVVADKFITIEKLGCLYEVGHDLISAVTVNAATGASGVAVVTSTLGTFANAAVVYDNNLAVAEAITLTFTSATDYTVVGATSGALGTGTVGDGFTSSLLGMSIPTTEFGGTYVAADTVVITVTAAVAGAALALDTDYKVEGQAGLINVLKGGTVSLNDVIAVSYTAEDMTASWETVLGSKNDKVDVAIKMIGTNRATGERGVLNIPKVSLLPASGIDFVSDDFIVASMSGSIQVCPNQADAYTFSAETAGSTCEI